MDDPLDMNGDFGEDEFSDYDRDDVLEVSSYEDYEHLKAKQKASVLWLLSKAYNNEIPPELKDPYYKDHEDQDRLKPGIVHSLANAELYCLTLAHIYADPNYNCLNHQGIIQVLTRKGIYVVEPHDTSLTETVLVQTAPVRMSAHLVIIEAIMALYIKEVLIPEKVVDVVNRFSDIDPNELPEDPEDAALFWINKSCAKMKDRMLDEINQTETCHGDSVPPLTSLEDLADMSDGCSLATLLSFYCSDHLPWNEICFNESMSMADSIYNLQLVQFFCQEKLPYNICFLSLEDFLYLHPTIRPNVLAFIADLLFLFEIRTAPCVRRPGTNDELFGEEKEDVNGSNGTKLRDPRLPTPAEMKAMSLQHTGWAHEKPKGGPITPKKSHRTSSARRSYHRSNSSQHSDDDEELTRYFSAIDINPEFDSSPELLMVGGGREGPMSLNPLTTYSVKKPVVTRPSDPLGNKSQPQENFTVHSHSNQKKPSYENGSEAAVSSPAKSTKSSSSANSHLADYFSQIGKPPAGIKTPKTTTTSFAKLCKSKELLNNDYRKEVSSSPENVKSPVINIAYSQKGAGVKSERERDRSSSRDSLYSGSNRQESPVAGHRDRSSSRDSLYSGSNQQQSPSSGFWLCQQKTLAQLNDSNLIKQCLEQGDPIPKPQKQPPLKQPPLKQPPLKQAPIKLPPLDIDEDLSPDDAPRNQWHEVKRQPNATFSRGNEANAFATYGMASRSVPNWAQEPEPEQVEGLRIEKEPVDNQVATQVYNIRLKLEEKRKKIEQERKQMEEYWKSQRQDIGKEAFLRVVKSKKPDQMSDVVSSEGSSEGSAPRDQVDTKGFFISFGEENKPKRPPPCLRPKQVKAQQQMKKETMKRKDVGDIMQHDDYSQREEAGKTFTTPSTKENVAPSDHGSQGYNGHDLEEEDPPRPLTPGVGFVIGSGLSHPDPMSELGMAKKKEAIMMQSLRRRAEQEANRITKERELARKREEERFKREQQERKRDEEKVRRQLILEQYRHRKAQQDAEKEGHLRPGDSSNLSHANNNTIVLNRPGRHGRPNSAGKPRPKSLHVSASTIQDYTSLDPRTSRITDDMMDGINYGYHPSSTSGHNGSGHAQFGGGPSVSSSRPQSALSGSNANSSRRPPSASSSSRHNLPSLPHSLLMNRHRGPPSDGASDAGSTFSEYTGPKLFVKPTQKSNRGIILNAINAVLGGAVNNDTKKRVIEEINISESKHFLVLFRGGGMQFRAIYSYNPDREEVLKLFGVGPKAVDDAMMDKFFKYNSGTKNFNSIQTKHLSATIDAFTIHNTLWAGKRVVPKKYSF